MTHAVRKVMEDSYQRTSSFEEVAEVIAEAFHHTEVRNQRVQKAINGE